MKIITVDNLRFKEVDGVLLVAGAASVDDVAWGKVATIPVKDYPDLKREFPVSTKQFRLATSAGVEPPSGQIYILSVCPPFDHDVRDVTPADRGLDPFRFSPTYFAVVKAP